MNNVEEFLKSTLSAADSAALRVLGGAVYPPRVLAGVRPQPVSAPPPAIDWPPERASRIFLIRHGEPIVATSRFLPRRVRTSRGPLDVLALAGVQTHPEFRGRGFGRAVVRAALAYVDRGIFDVSLFQTGVPEFYEKLACRRVSNPFTNALAADPAGVPWWEHNIMIYPAEYPWPEGPIDLQGPGW